jgi:hypothetical protein
MPKQYIMEEEELDECVINGDDELLEDVDPECLPRMVRYVVKVVIACTLSAECWIFMHLFSFLKSHSTQPDSR